jgi:hypothetical protein
VAVIELRQLRGVEGGFGTLDRVAGCLWTFWVGMLGLVGLP